MAAGQAKIDIEFGLTEIRRKARLYELYRNYYEGIHRLTFATKDWKNEFGTIFSAFADNLCPTVIGAVRNRLSVIGFSAQAAEKPPRPLLSSGRIGGESDDADAAWSVWNRNRMDRRQKGIYKRALIAGEVAVIVWTDPANEREAVIYPQKPDRVAVRYSEETPGRIELGVKAWIQPDKRARVTLYYDDRIERYVTPTRTQGGIPEKAERLIEWTGTPDAPEEFETLNPVERVPIVMFGYDSEEGEPGRSRLTDVVPLQDALNKVVADMLIAGEFQAVPQRLVIGWSPTEFLPDGSPKPPWKSGSDRILTLANENAKVAEWAAANLKAFIEVQDSFRAEIARVSQTPLHYLLLTGQFPSGDAMHAAEAPLDAVVSDTQDGFGVSHEELIDLCLRFERGGTGAKLTTLWRPKPSLKPKEHAETGEIKKRLKVSDRQILREQGYSDPEIDEMYEEQAEDDAGVAARGDEPPIPFVTGAGGLEGGLPSVTPAIAAVR